MHEESRFQFRPKRLYREILVLTGVLALAACGGGGGGSSTAGGSQTNNDGEVLSSLTTGYELPTEISAVPANNSTVAASLNRSFSSHLRTLARAASSLPATSDFKKAQTRKYIEERTLEQFEIIETIMNALAQTHYADEAVINQGAYKAIVSWEEEKDGRDTKTLQPWVVKSDMIMGQGPDGVETDINRVRVWIVEPDENQPGQTHTIKAEFKIYQAASANADGSYDNYGEWDLNVKFDDTGAEYFAASARIDNNGMTVLKIAMEESHDDGPGAQPMTWDPKAVMYRSGDAGYGRVSYPDHQCDQNGCQMITKEAKYAYNADYLAVQEVINSVDQATVFKDRNSQTDFTHRYGLFYAAADANAGIAAGDRVQKHKSFGFPLRYIDGNGASRHAYYGAWQGRHELWGGGPNGGGITPGTTVTREDFGPNQNAQQYVVSPKFSGTLTRRTLVDGDLSDIQDIAVETWINKHFDLRYDANAGEWQHCDGWINWQWDQNAQMSVPTCMNHDGTQGTFAPFTAFDMLVVGEKDRKWVGIGRWDQSANGGMGGHMDLVYLSSDPGGISWSGAGFYPAEMGNNGQRMPKAGGSRYTPSDGDSMWIDIGGSIYIQYTGEFSGPTTTTGWVQKTLTDFDQQNWTPSFDANGDSEFTPEMGRDYYINSKGANFVVKRVSQTLAPTSYEVKIELQTAANPVSYASILPAGTSYLRTPWRKEVSYRFVTDATDANFLKLIYLTDDPNTQDVDESATPTVYTSGEWGLQAYSDNGTPNDTSDDVPLMANGAAVTVDQWGIPTNPDQRPVEFNWEYSTDGWGTQQFLCTGDCSVTTNYVMLSDPIQLQPVTVANGAQVNKTLSLQYDGWMHGLPDLYWELSKNNWTMSQSIAGKVINIPAGTEVIDTNDVHYYVKPLEISVFLNVVDGNSLAQEVKPDIAQAGTVDFNVGMPTYTEHNMGAVPSNVVTKYSEGKLIE